MQWLKSTVCVQRECLILIFDTAHLFYLTCGCSGTYGDVQETTPRFTFPPNAKFSSSSFTIVDDDVYEYDELIVAVFEFDRRFLRRYNTIKGQPNMTYIMIKDDDSECPLLTLLSCRQMGLQ